MKRIFPVLLGALAGAIGLPVVMFGSRAVIHLLVPQLFGLTPTTFGLIFHSTITSNIGRLILVSGALLGAWSVVLWGGERGFWPRFGSAISSAGAVTIPIWVLNRAYQAWGRRTPPLFTAGFFRSLLVLYLPLILWSLALFFFALLARRRIVLR